MIAKRIKSGESVLIDTWWNVNTSCLFMIIRSAPVLIDTWWNVNKGSDLDQYGDNEFE